jgi:DNA-binding IscR family transcriptional regulator
MRLTKSTSHAIRILIDCARAEGRLVKVAELSSRLKITPQNVFKIVNLLARAHLIEAVRGRNGAATQALRPRRRPLPAALSPRPAARWLAGVSSGRP